MAKTHALVRHHTFGRPAPVVIMKAPSRGRVRRAARAVGGVARRVGRRAAPSLPLFGTVAAAGALGYLEAQKKLNFIPTIMGSRAATFGIAGFLATRFKRLPPTVRMIGAAAAIAGAFDIGRVKGGGVSGFDDDGGAGPGGGL
jgi:hypothetical protein